MAARETFYSVEYAKSNRSTCKKLKTQIPAGGLRIGRHFPSPFHDGYAVEWYLPKGFFQTKHAKNVKYSSQLRGFAHLKVVDQDMLRKFIGEEAAPATTETSMESHSKLWDVKDYLMNNAQLKELRASLELNGVRSHGGQNSLVNRVADGIVFGKATCATCPHQDLCQLKFEDGTYNCVADLQWGKCGYKGTSVVVHPWKRHSELFDHHSFLRSWPTDPLNRDISKARKETVKFYKRDPKLPLVGMKFSAAGRLPKRKHSELRSFINSNGGTYMDSIVPDLDYVVSTYSEYMTNRPKIALVKQLELAVVSELLVERLVLEFGFDQEPYLIAGNLPPIAYATLSIENPEANDDATSQTSKSSVASQSFSKTTVPPEVLKSHPHAQVYRENNEYFNILLNQTDIMTGNNKYYHLLLFDENGKGEEFGVFRKWGRVGTTIGSTTIQLNSDFDSSFDTFKIVYKDKTGNDWKDRNDFKKMPNSYFPIFVEEADTSKKGENENNDNIPSYVDPRVGKLVNLIFDVNMLTREMKSLDIDIRKMPLGKLSQATIRSGYSILNEIEAVLISDNPSKSFLLLNLSNRFYTIIPTDFGKRAPPLIDTNDMLQQKMKQLEALMEIEVASSLLHKESILGQHPTDTNYQRLGTKLEPLSKYSRDFKLVEKYLNNGYDPAVLGYTITIEDVFAATRPEDPEFTERKHIRPRKLLWHGSRLCNFVGILNQGLKIAPPEAPSSGYLFGKGLYFADRVQKSAPYCYPSKDNTEGLLLLFDVVVGDTYTVKKPEFITQLPEGKHSTLVLAKNVPDATKDEIGDDKVVVPCGCAISSGEKDVFLEDQEYVVYKKQVHLKYVLKVKFNFLKS